MDFVSELALADLEIDRHFAEPFDLVPMREIVNAKPVADLTRYVLRDVAGIFDDNAHRLNAAGAPGRIQSLPGVSFRSELLPDGIQQEDRLIRKLTGQVYRALAPHPDAQGRVVVPLHVIAPALPSPGVFA